VSVINILGQDHPNFKAAGGIQRLAKSLSETVGPPKTLTPEEITIHKTIKNIPPEIMRKYTVMQTDKGVGPVIVSNKWLDI
jgi:hypothetical protein